MVGVWGTQGWLVKGLCKPGRWETSLLQHWWWEPPRRFYTGEWQGHCRELTLAPAWIRETGGREASELSDATVQVKG